MVKHTLKILQCLQLENFKSVFNHFSILRMNQHVIVIKLSFEGALQVHNKAPSIECLKETPAKMFSYEICETLHLSF